jgi:hypothetical protein
VSVVRQVQLEQAHRLGIVVHYENLSDRLHRKLASSDIVRWGVGGEPAPASRLPSNLGEGLSILAVLPLA